MKNSSIKSKKYTDVKITHLDNTVGHFRTHSACPSITMYLCINTRLTPTIPAKRENIWFWGCNSQKWYVTASQNKAWLLYFFKFKKNLMIYCMFFMLFICQWQYQREVGEDLGEGMLVYVISENHVCFGWFAVNIWLRVVQ